MDIFFRDAGNSSFFLLPKVNGSDGAVHSTDKKLTDQTLNTRGYQKVRRLMR